MRLAFRHVANHEDNDVSIRDLEILAGSVRRRKFTRVDKEAIVSETLNGETLLVATRLIGHWSTDGVASLVLLRTPGSEWDLFRSRWRLRISRKAVRLDCSLVELKSMSVMAGACELGRL